MPQHFDCTNPGERATGITAAVAAIRRGALVVLPTDSAYAVATDAFHPAGTAALRRAKGRPESAGGTLPVLVAEPGVLDALTYQLPTTGRDLVAALWPGPLTLIARQQPSLSWDVTDGSRLAVRMPLHPVALEILAAAGPVAATGANYSGMSVPSTADEAYSQLGDAVAVYLDAGPMSDEFASAVVDVTTNPATVLRTGSVPLERLQQICPGAELST